MSFEEVLGRLGRREEAGRQRVFRDLECFLGVIEFVYNLGVKCAYNFAVGKIIVAFLLHK